MKRWTCLGVSLGAILVLLPAPPAHACSVCGCGDPLLTASDPAAITGKLRFQADTEYLRVDAGADSGHADRPFRAMPITCSGQGDRPGRDAAG